MSGKHPHDDLPVGCIHHQGLSRRKFLAGCAACAGAAGLAAAPRWLEGAPGAGPRAGKVKIRVIYALHGPQQKDPDWPNKGFDFGPVMDRINAELLRRCPDCEFVPTLATGEEQAKKILDGDKAGDIDGYLVYQMNCWNHVVQTLGDVRQARPLRRFPVRRQRRLPGLYGRLSCAARLRNVGFRRLLEASKTWSRRCGCFAAAKAGGPGFDFAAAVARVRVGQDARARRSLGVAADPVAGPVPGREPSGG